MQIYLHSSIILLYWRLKVSQSSASLEELGIPYFIQSDNIRNVETYRGVAASSLLHNVFLEEAECGQNPLVPGGVPGRTLPGLPVGQPDVPGTHRVNPGLQLCSYRVQKGI